MDLTSLLQRIKLNSRRKKCLSATVDYKTGLGSEKLMGRCCNLEGNSFLIMITEKVVE